ncbi:hypothetical protein OAV88_03435 [bacterium]|jgi:hypothetical protein|nr:hypothetical protein [bacterium]
MTRVQALFNKCRKNKINPEIPSIVINNDDWNNVAMDVLEPYNVMDWDKRVWGEWASRDMKFYANRRVSVGAEVSRPKPLFMQKPAANFGPGW